MALKLKGSTSGFVAIDAPSVAGNNTLILPENTGSAGQILANDITAGVTTFTSVTVNRNGDLTVPGTISIGGTLTYEDVTNVDSVGVITARTNLILGDSLKHLGDENTLISFPANDTITAETSGTEALRIDSSGNVNLGASAANTAIQASGPFSGATPKLEIKLGGASNSYTRLINIANPSGATGSETLGRVGIKLALGSETNGTETAKAGIIYAESTSTFNNAVSLCLATNNTERMRIDSSGDYLFLGGTLRIKNSANNAQRGAIYGDSTSFHVNAAGNLKLYSGGGERVRFSDIGQISIRGTNTAFDTTGDLDSLQMYYETDSGQASIGPYSSGGNTHLSFYTNASGNAATEKLRITSTGQIGVGVNAPTFAAINSISANAARGIEIFKDGTDTGSAIKLAGDNGSGNKAYSQLGYSGANATTHWANYNTSGSKVGEIVIGSTGNVGINESTATAKLHVTAAYNETALIAGGGAINYNSCFIFKFANGDTVLEGDNGRHVVPGADAVQDLGISTKRWRNVYTTDLQLSNVGGGGNEVDGTEGSWTLQEGESDIYMINRKTGKKYKMMLQEVS